MRDQLHPAILQATGADCAERGDVIQSLWSGYGEIVRYRLSGAAMPSVVLKHVIFPSEVNHPRGWHNDHSHQRKVRSYEVEMHWYAHEAQHCPPCCRVPVCYAARSIGDDHVIILEDLDAAGFAMRHSSVDLDGVHLCLSWLAHFHARFMGHHPEGLWPTGTYWHLATRPDECAAITDPQLQEAAPVIDSLLSRARFQTLVHGDAKLANFCFTADGQGVAAVDFQYIGGGCGMKDVAYFLGSCLSDREQEQHESDLLDDYFETLSIALLLYNKQEYFHAIENEWRGLFAVAQADFYRFLAGWMPTHWKINDYNSQVTRAVIAGL